jgi:hypothetical protein
LIVDPVDMLRLKNRSMNDLPQFLHLTLRPLNSTGAFSLAAQCGHSTVGNPMTLPTWPAEMGDSQHEA